MFGVLCILSMVGAILCAVLFYARCIEVKFVLLGGTCGNEYAQRHHRLFMRFQKTSRRRRRRRRRRLVQTTLARAAAC